MEVKIYTKPLTEKQRLTKKHQKDILTYPARYHLIDCLKQLKFGRPVKSQEQIDKWIAELTKGTKKKARDHKSKILQDFFYKKEILAFAKYCSNGLKPFSEEELEKHYEDFFKNYEFKGFV